MSHVRTAIKNAIIYAFENRINTTNGYNYNYVINDPPKSHEQFAKLPAVNLSFGMEMCSNWETGNHLQKWGNEAKLHNMVDMVLDIYHMDGNNSTLAAENILYDVQKYLGNNYYIPDSNNNRTVFNCIYKDSIQFGVDVNKPNCGISITYVIWYNQLLTSPDTLA